MSLSSNERLATDVLFLPTAPSQGNIYTRTYTSIKNNFCGIVVKRTCYNNVVQAIRNLNRRSWYTSRYREFRDMML